MRVSTSMIFNTGTNGIRNLQGELYKTHNQLSTGRRILTPADDPVGASEALRVTQSKNVNERFIENQAQAQTKLNFLDTTLDSLNNELQAIYENTVAAGNASYSPEQRGMIAEELKRRLENLIGLANTRDGTGQYIFAGYKTTTEPFTQNTAATQPYSLGSSLMTYNGDSGNPTLSVTASKDMAVADNGMSVFMQVKDAQGNVVGRSMFDSVQNLIDILDPSSGVPYNATDYAQALGDMKSAIDHVAMSRASVGARMQALEGMTSAGEDISVNYDLRLSALQDLDWTDAISKFSQYKTQLEAAQLTFQQTSQLSLFNLL